MSEVAYLLVNFGGPRNQEEVEEFLVTLLTDQEVIRTPLPAFLHRLLFTRVAKKRSLKIVEDYALIGGKSPIYEDTENLAKELSLHLGKEVMTFHRYLPKTHPLFMRKIEALKAASEIVVLPLFPQFSYATTGSIALFFKKHLSSAVVRKMRWIRSYADHPSYIAPMESTLREFLHQHQLLEREVCLLFSAHGLPQEFVDKGDSYQKECLDSFELIKKAFPEAVSVISYQSQFGKQPWILPYTSEVCKQIGTVAKERRHVVVIPLSFTSDHIETLYEVEYTYLPVIREAGLKAYRCPALNLRADWIQGMGELFIHASTCDTQALLRV